MLSKKKNKSINESVFHADFTKLVTFFKIVSKIESTAHYSGKKKNTTEKKTFKIPMRFGAMNKTYIS